MVEPRTSKTKLKSVIERLEKSEAVRAGQIKQKQDPLWKSFGLLQTSYDEWNAADVSGFFLENL